MKVLKAFLNDKTKSAMFVLMFLLAILFGISHIPVVKTFLATIFGDGNIGRGLTGGGAFTSFLFGIFRNGTKQREKDLTVIKKEVRILTKRVKKIEKGTMVKLADGGLIGPCPKGEPSDA